MLEGTLTRGQHPRLFFIHHDDAHLLVQVEHAEAQQIHRLALQPLVEAVGARRGAGTAAAARDDGGKGGQGTEGLEGGVGVEEEAEERLQLRQEGEGERLHLVEDAQHVLGEAGN